MKKLLSVLLAAVMMLSTFTACGGGSGEQATDDGEKVLFIGGSGPLTGDYATYGTSVKNGATLAMEEINAKAAELILKDLPLANLFILEL